MKLFTPGPVNTSRYVKETIKDLASRDTEVISIIQKIRTNLLKIANVNDDNYRATLFAGSGTYAIESCLTSSIPLDGKILIIENGKYGQRMIKIVQIHQIEYMILSYSSNEIINIEDIKQILQHDKKITHIAMVYSETSSGILNPVKEISNMARKYNKIMIVDAMSAFGGIPMNLENIDFTISSSNKCIQGLPGISFIIGKIASINLCKINTRTLSLDLYQQEKCLEQLNQFRFTPPIQIILAFDQAIKELLEETVEKRYERYQQNQQIVLKEITNIFTPYLDENKRGPIVTAFKYPKEDWWSFKIFYEKLKQKGNIIYPNFNTPFFRIGHIGDIQKDDVEKLVEDIKIIVEEMKN